MASWIFISLITVSVIVGFIKMYSLNADKQDRYDQYIYELSRARRTMLDGYLNGVPASFRPPENNYLMWIQEELRRIRLEGNRFAEERLIQSHYRMQNYQNEVSRYQREVDSYLQESQARLATTHSYWVSRADYLNDPPKEPSKLTNDATDIFVNAETDKAGAADPALATAYQYRTDEGNPPAGAGDSTHRRGRTVEKPYSDYDWEW